MRGVLVSIDAWDPVAAAVVTVRMGSAGNSSTLGADGYTWEPTLSRRPRLSMQTTDEDLSGKLAVGAGEFQFNVGRLKRIANAIRLEWIGAPVRVYSGDSHKLSDLTLEFAGHITGGVADANTGIVPAQMEVDRQIVDVPAFLLTYGGGGAADGDVELRGQNKPAAFGSPINVKPVLVNQVYSVYQADAYGALGFFAGVYEDLASFGAPLGDYPTYAALIAAVIPEGQWATCNALGMFRLGAPAAGTITCDPVCFYNTPASFMRRLIEFHAGVPTARIRTADFATLDTGLQTLLGGVPYTSYYSVGSDNVLDLVEAMCGSCNAMPLFMLDGTITVSRMVGGATALTLNRQGGNPRVTAWSASDSPTPWWRMKMPAAKSYYVNPPGEIDYEDDIVDRGDYDPAETYRQGNVARWTDGARYLYINPTPATGHPPTDAAYWDPTPYENAPDATTVRYTSGFTLQAKEPAEAGANVTVMHTAAGVLGQTVYATLAAGTSLDNPAFGMPVRMQPSALDNAYLDAAKITYTGGPSTVSVQSLMPAEAAANVTVTHTAAAITGQGPLATASSVNLATQVSGTLGTANAATGLVNSSIVANADGTFTGGPTGGVTYNGLGGGPLGLKARLYFGDALLTEDSAGATVATLNKFKTALGVAAGITGQAATATSTDYSVITGATRPANNATADIVIAANAGSMSIIGNSITKMTSTNVFDTSAVGDQLKGICRLSAQTSYGQEIALSLSSAFANSVDAQTYQIRTEADEYAYAYVNGVKDSAPLAYFDGNSLFEIASDNVNVYLLISGLLVRTYAVASGTVWQPFYHLKTPNAVIRNIKFTVWTDRLFANMGGATRPEDNATVGTVFGINARETAGGVIATLANFKTASGTAAGIIAQAAWATYSALTPTNVAGQVQYLDTSGNLASIQRITDRKMTLLTRADGTTGVTEAAVVTALGNAAGFSGQGYLATKNYASMDADVTDGSTYARILASQLSSGAHKLTVAGSGVKLGDQRNIPAVTALNLRSRFSGQSVTYSATAGSPATATVSVSAFTALMGSSSVSYNSSSVGVSGSGGSTVTYWLYFDDGAYAGGTKTLVAATSLDTVLSSDSRVFVGTVDVTFPTSGSGGGTGGGGGGGGCVHEDSWMDDERQARNIFPAELIYLPPDGLTTGTPEPAIVRQCPTSVQPCFRLTTESGAWIIASATTPMDLRDGRFVYFNDMLGEDVLVDRHGQIAWEKVAALDSVGAKRVVWFYVDDRMYYAGGERGVRIATHNVLPNKSYI